MTSFKKHNKRDRIGTTYSPVAFMVPETKAQEKAGAYDSLSRPIRERQVEQTTNASYNLSDSLTGNSSWTSKFDYNSHGL